MKGHPELALKVLPSYVKVLSIYPEGLSGLASSQNQSLFPSFFFLTYQLAESLYLIAILRSLTQI